MQQSLTPEILVPRVGEYLVEKGHITPEDLKRALEIQRTYSRNQPVPLLGQVLVDMGVVSRELLDQSITEMIIQLRTALVKANNELEHRVRQRTNQLQEALNKLSELDRLKSNFVANISHELRTPMTHIKGYLDLLLDETFGSLNPEQQQTLNIIKQSSERLENLIEGLILFSSVEQGNLKVQAQKVNLNQLLDDVIIRSTFKAQEKQVQICRSPMDDNLDVLADQQTMTWALMQLIDNAIKFSPSGGDVWVKTEKVNILVEISIIDSGIGIPQEKYSEIFEPFHQLDESSTRKYGGTGMGLSLVKEIIDAHGSTIHLFSEPEKGSKFTFTLRVAS